VLIAFEWVVYVLNESIDNAERLVLMTGCITPKALANFSPGLERSDNPGIIIKNP